MKFFTTIFFLLSLVLQTFSQSTSLSLNKDWSFSQKGKEQWVKATVPGSVYTDLMDNKIIEHPFFGKNEADVKWVDSATWVYQTTFTLEEHQKTAEKINLIFDGLDTYASVYFNQQYLGSTNNMFRQWRFPIKLLIKTS